MGTGIWLVAALFLCPPGTIVDQVEGPILVVLGASGVRVIARADVHTQSPNGVREGDRLQLAPDGSCHAVPVPRLLLRRLTNRLRNLRR